MASPRAARRVRQPYSVPTVCVLLLLAVLAVFGQTVGHDFFNLHDNGTRSVPAALLSSATDRGEYA